jgi:hypothetical protein
MMNQHGPNITHSARDLIKYIFQNLIFSGFLFYSVPDASANGANESAFFLTASYAINIDKRLEPPIEEIRYYADLTSNMLDKAGVRLLQPQYLAVVDRNPKVQALFLYWFDSEATLQLIGASPVSTGKPGRFDYFETPLGVFQHLIDNLDFRAEGTKNENGIRGYGTKGMRVFDFGWQQANKGWGDRRVSTMRLQMHATDPDILENRLGTAQSKGCIRIPASLNRFIDQHGLLDADYELAMQEGKSFWMLSSTARITPWPGRYLVVLDSLREQRPRWAIFPGKTHSKKN